MGDKIRGGANVWLRTATTRRSSSGPVLPASPGSSATPRRGNLYRVIHRILVRGRVGRRSLHGRPPSDDEKKFTNLSSGRRRRQRSSALCPTDGCRWSRAYSAAVIVRSLPGKKRATEPFRPSTLLAVARRVYAVFRRPAFTDSCCPPTWASGWRQTASVVCD